MIMLISRQISPSRATRLAVTVLVPRMLASQAVSAKANSKAIAIMIRRFCIFEIYKNTDDR